jgi:hypothetical protein
MNRSDRGILKFFIPKTAPEFLKLTVAKFVIIRSILILTDVKD